MSAEPLSIRDAWTQIPSPGSAETEFERFTGKRMERILQTVVAIGSLVTGAQALLAALSGVGVMDAAHVAMIVVVFAPLSAMLVCCVLGRGVRAASAAFAFLYVGALIAWPFVVDPADDASTQQPWIFFLVNVGVVAAMLAFSLRMQYVWAIGVPLGYGFVRLMQGGFEREFWITTAFDVSFTIILGLVLVSLGWMFRAVAAGVDDVRGRAVAAYAHAAAAAAAEEERVAVAALMHDSVLAALIAAERAESPRARDLAVGMAREALTRLANTEAAVLEEGSDDPVGSAQIVAELRRALSETGADAVVEEHGGVGLIPGRAARALVLAARQAIGNSVAHARGRGLHIVALAHGDEGITVTVSDAGPGFDPDAVGADRLGIRASIMARMAAVAGMARIESGESGTVVELSWERE
ncbi:ATP-binding protein [Microbacterium sp. CIAB417]|uniref:ATP-binding protein n=1 Tax=Microbacterium sp. CIAB417 TaxID=2860287 RepID=UPI001FAE30BB|nr:ATP-binding protein [Microbacterium sp. CIAB417]